MPIYDYTCSSCRRVTEVIHGINDHGPKFCPECGVAGTMTKKFVAPTVHFKGSGWAKKDRSSSARSARAKDDKGASGGDSTSTGSGSDSGSDGIKADAKKSDAGSSGGASGTSSTGDSSASTGSSD